MSSPYTLPAIVLITVFTLALGAFGYRFSRTTSDFLVASRTVSPRWNASAISGEYLSAASFLGVAGLVMKFGADVLWYPVGFTAGYLAMLLFVAAPLRRSGAYTLPDFAELRLHSAAVRRMSTAFVVLIGWLYLVPQLQGAGLTLSTVLGAPGWLGASVVGVVVTVNVAVGGMRSITFVQAFQYWIKLTAICVPAAFLLLHWQAARQPGSLTGPELPSFPDRTTVRVRADAAVTVDEPVTFTAHGVLDGQRRDGQVRWSPGPHQIDRDAVLTFPAGAPVPRLHGVPKLDNATWSQPLSGLSGTGQHPLFGIYSLILATFLGTMGLPHVLVRFYTNPDGRAARKTTLVVLGLLGLFYLFPTLYGALGRLYTPQLLLTGRTDAVVLVLPGAALGGLVGQLLAGLVAAGAFAAFLSTSSGLLVNVSGVLATDVLGRGSVRDFRRAALLAGVVPLVLALQVSGLDVSQVVGLAFAVAASTFCPLLVLGVWWRGLTAVGAGVGLLAGGVLSAAAVLITVLGADFGGWPGALLTEPAAWSVPTAFLVMVVVSRLTRGRVPADVGRTMLRLHAPETLRSRPVRVAGPDPVQPAPGAP
ncbi:MAG TPA: cation acetate symporter [Mycobacteriales bacterium]|nr:cation acetate symporter [Mycobacteriales bacterium]